LFAKNGLLDVMQVLLERGDMLLFFNDIRTDGKARR
jgi:hypothetical protein